MCKSATPEDEQVRCSRCGIIANPTDDWETEWPMHGDITIGNSSVIQWALMKRVDPNYSDRENALKQTVSVMDATHPAVKNFEYQKIQIEWGHDKKYRLCWDCQHELLEIIGEFFFKTLPKDQPIKVNK